MSGIANNSELRSERFWGSFRMMRVAESSNFLGYLAPENAAMSNDCCNEWLPGEAKIDLEMYKQIYMQWIDSASSFWKPCDRGRCSIHFLINFPITNCTGKQTLSDSNKNKHGLLLCPCWWARHYELEIFSPNWWWIVSACRPKTSPESRA
jgi:hypothetical protein